MLSLELVEQLRHGLRPNGIVESVAARIWGVEPQFVRRCENKFTPDRHTYAKSTPCLPNAVIYSQEPRVHSKAEQSSWKPRSIAWSAESQRQ